MTKAKQKRLILELCTLEFQILQVKDLYRKRDEVANEMRAAGIKKFSHKAVDGTLVDNYSEKNVQWKTVAFNRWSYDLKPRLA